MADFKIVKIKSLGGEQLEIKYGPQDTILDLKVKLKNDHPIQPDPTFIKLICSGKLAINTQKISEFVANSDVIHFIYNGPKKESAEEKKEAEQGEKQSSESSATTAAQAFQPKKVDAKTKNSRLNKIRKLMYENYILEQKLEQYHLQECLNFMQHKNIEKHPVLGFDTSIKSNVRLRSLKVDSIVDGSGKEIGFATDVEVAYEKEPAETKVEKVKPVAVEETKTGEKADGDKKSDNQHENTTETDAKAEELRQLIDQMATHANNPETTDDTQNTETENANAQTEANAPAAAAPAPVADNQPPAEIQRVEPEQQFDIIERLFSLLQIGYILSGIFGKSKNTMEDLIYYGGLALLFILYKLWRKGYFRPARRNNNNENPANSENTAGENNTVNPNNLPPPGFITVLKTFVVGFVRSLVPEQLPPGAQLG